MVWVVHLLDGVNRTSSFSCGISIFSSVYLLGLDNGHWVRAYSGICSREFRRTQWGMTRTDMDGWNGMDGMDENRVGRIWKLDRGRSLSVHDNRGSLDRVNDIRVKICDSISVLS